MSVAPPPVDGHGYVTEVAYRPSFHAEQAPAAMRAAVALSGFEPPKGDDYDALEIGPGPGRTMLLLAAANPGSRFVGVDLLPEHVAEARDLAAKGRVENARFEQGDLADIDGGALGAFDYVAAHGVYTWVSPALRARLAAVASAALRPGGLFYVSYNAMPGWSAAEPLRRLLVDAAARASGDLSTRAEQALAYADLLRQHGAAYFAQNPAAVAMLSELLAKHVSYVLHEHYNEHSGAVWFADVARGMLAHDLHYVASLPLYLNYRDLALPPAVAPLFRGAADRGWFEAQKDFATNAFFRRDVYRKGAAPHVAAAADRFLESEAFATVSPAEDTPRSVSLPYATMGFTGPIYDGLVRALGGDPVTVEELAASEQMRGRFSRRQVLDALRNLVVAGLVAPMRPGPLADPPPLNRALLAGWTEGDGPLALASPRTGSGVLLDEPTVSRLAGGERPPAVTRLGLLSRRG
ncbi:MAG TPA: methyltransferase domain-containing protein [Minicystis sp.]|nr:methyltransferase domain-containing protein [Minicystis sp.]